MIAGAVFLTVGEYSGDCVIHTSDVARSNGQKFVVLGSLRVGGVPLLCLCVVQCGLGA
jgi:hypothetical protein